MTFTIQEVPEWDISDISDEEFKMYDLTIPDILSEQGECSSGMVPERMVPEGIKVEDPYLAYQPATSVMSSPSGSGLCESYNPCFYGSAQEFESSPLSYTAYSPADNSTISVVPVQQLPPEGMCQDDLLMQYLSQQQQSLQQPYGSPHVVSQVNGCGLYYSNYAGKRRLLDHELTPIEYEKRRLRRERNKEAALRCRTKRRDRIEALEKETNEIEAQNAKVELDISKLQNQIKELQSILKGHVCQKKNVVKSEVIKLE